MDKLVYFRDQITINDAFVSELKAELLAKKVPAGSTLFIGARAIVHNKNYTFRLEGYNLVIAADAYDPAGGAIDVSGHAGAAGASGKTGAKGSVSAGGYGDKPGGNGGAGGAGGAGTPGMQVTLFCRNMKKASVFARGGNGGNGGNGGKGGSGLAVVVDPEGGKYKEPIGSDGGKGGNGGNGNNGGKGGKVTVFYIKAAAAPVTSASGGAAGVGGAAGLGGKGGPTAVDGKPGVKGANGTKGADGSSSVQQLTEPQFWAALRTALGIHARTWAEYRTRGGEYLFRTASSGGSSGTLKIHRAAREFRAAIQLDAAAERAQTLLHCIHHKMNPLGMSRDHYLTPDFLRYEEAFTDYAPLVQEMAISAQGLLQHAHGTEHNRQLMKYRRQGPHAAGGVCLRVEGVAQTHRASP